MNGKLIVSSKVKNYLNHNRGMIFLFVISIAMFTLSTFGFVEAIVIEHDLEGAIFIIAISYPIAGFLLFLSSWFFNSHFEIYEDKFLPPLIRRKMLFRGEKEYVPFSEIKKIMISESKSYLLFKMESEAHWFKGHRYRPENWESLKVVVVYTKNNDKHMVGNNIVDTKTLNKFIEILKEYAENHGIEVLWHQKK